MAKNLTPDEIAKLFERLDKAPKVESRTTDRDYYESPLWKRIRLRVLKRDNRICKRCGGEATLVHHRNYDQETLQGRADENLVSLCEGCHNFIHLDDQDHARSWPEVERLLATPTAVVKVSAPKLTRAGNLPRQPRQQSRMSAVQREAWRRGRNALIPQVLRARKR